MIITNFKLIDFFNQKPELINDYAVALRYLKPMKTRKQVFHLKLKHVEFIKQALSEGTDKSLIEVVGKVQKLPEEDVLDLPIVDFFGLVNSIEKQITAILKAEESSLVPSEINQKWEMVDGGRKMAKFGIYNTLERLSGGDILKYKKIMNLDYSEVFTILLMQKTSADLSAEMDKLKTK